MVESVTLVASIALALSVGINAVIVRSSNRTPRLSRRDDMNAVQAAHSHPTPRLGGLGVFIGFGAALLLLSYLTTELIPIHLLISALPIFSAGLLEDLGRRQSPRRRLFAAALSGGVAIAVLHTWIKNSGLSGIDLLLAIPPIGVAITIIWSAGVCNAVNLVDGVNGLAGTLALSISAALAYIAWSAGDVLMAQIAVALAAGITGFLVFNWPRGKLSWEMPGPTPSDICWSGPLS